MAKLAKIFNLRTHNDVQPKKAVKSHDTFSSPVLKQSNSHTQHLKTELSKKTSQLKTKAVAGWNKVTTMVKNIKQKRKKSQHLDNRATPQVIAFFKMIKNELQNKLTYKPFIFFGRKPYNADVYRDMVTRLDNLGMKLGDYNSNNNELLTKINGIINESVASVNNSSAKESAKNMIVDRLRILQSSMNEKYRCEGIHSKNLK